MFLSAHMRKIGFILTVVLALLATTGCSTMKVFTEHNKPEVYAECYSTPHELVLPYSDYAQGGMATASSTLSRMILEHLTMVGGGEWNGVILYDQTRGTWNGVTALYQKYMPIIYDEDLYKSQKKNRSGRRGRRR